MVVVEVYYYCIVVCVELFDVVVVLDLEFGVVYGDWECLIG